LTVNAELRNQSTGTCLNEVYWVEGCELLHLQACFTPSIPESFSLMDAWGHPIHFACPGPVHAAGWDLWSSGPNGVDEPGQDDLLLGEDLPATRRSDSSSRQRCWEMRSSARCGLLFRLM